MSTRFIVRRTFVVAFVLLLSLTVAAASGGRVIGVVTDTDGNKLKDVRIKLVPKDPSFTEIEIRTNKKGKFGFGLIRAGEYRLVAFADGMRIAHIDANIAIPDDDSAWAVDQDVEQGAELPTFAVSGLTKMTYDLVFEPHAGDPGEYGTGLPVSPIKVILDAIEEDRLDEAIEDVEANLERAPENPTLNYLAAFAYRAAGSLDRALETINTCLRVDPAFEGASLLKGKILSMMGRPDEALELYRGEATAASSEAVRRDTLLEQAILLQDLGRDGEAIEALEQLIELAPDLVAAYGDLAALYLKTEQPDKAKIITEKVMMIGGSNPDLLYNLGVERFNHSDFPSAEGYFAKVIDLAPDHVEAHLQLGYTKLNLGETDAAVEHLKKYLEVASDDHPGRSTAQAIVQQLTGS